MMNLKLTYTSLVVGVFTFAFICLDVQLYKRIQCESRFNITITVKAAMLDHVNIYILQPLSEQLVEATKFPYHFPSITADQISYLGLVAAFIAARLVLNDNLWVRRIAVFTFFVRQYLDDLDGVVARIRLGIGTTKQVSIPNTSGYLVDGLCDGIGFVVFLFAVFRWSRNRQTNKQNILPINSEYFLLKTPLQPNPQKRRLVKYYLLFLAQMGMSSLFWNHFLIKYHRVLDPNLTTAADIRSPLQEEIFKSSLMFMIMWLWRILNPHAITNYFLLSVWMNKPTQYAKWSSQYAFWVILGTSLLCEVQFQDIIYRLGVPY